MAKVKSNIEDFKNQCAGKVAHTTLNSAQYVLDRMKTSVGEILEIYICKFCKKFHIGHKVGTKHKTPPKKLHIQKHIKYKLTEE